MLAGVSLSFFIQSIHRGHVIKENLFMSCWRLEGTGDFDFISSSDVRRTFVAVLAIRVCHNGSCTSYSRYVACYFGLHAHEDMQTPVHLIFSYALLIQCDDVCTCGRPAIAGSKTCTASIKRDRC